MVHPCHGGEASNQEGDAAWSSGLDCLSSVSMLDAETVMAISAITETETETKLQGRTPNKVLAETFFI